MTNSEPLAPATTTGREEPSRLTTDYTSADGGKRANWIAALDSWIVHVEFVLIQPLFVPPLSGSDYEGHRPGFHGIKSLDSTVHFATSASRAWRCCRYPVTDTDASPAYHHKTRSLHMWRILNWSWNSIHPKGVNYQTRVWWLILVSSSSSEQPTDHKVTLQTDKDAGGYINTTTSMCNPSRGIHCPRIPEKLGICASMCKRGAIHAHRFRPWRTHRHQATANLIQQPGVDLSTRTAAQLDDAPVQSGLASLTYREFVGSAPGPRSPRLLIPPPWSTTHAWPIDQHGDQCSMDASQGIMMMPLTSSLGVLDFARSIPLTSEYDAPGSLEHCTLQTVADIENQQKDWWASDERELVVLTIPTGSSCEIVAAATRLSACQLRSWCKLRPSPTLSRNHMREN